MIDRRKLALSAHPAWQNLDCTLLLALLLSVVPALPLLIGPGIVNTRAGGDSPFLLQRVYELAASIRAGTVPAQWMSLGAYGLGYPFFGYYAALPYYLAAILDLAGAGVLWGIKLAQLGGFMIAGAATCLLVRRMGGGRSAALLASAAYTFAPFHIINVYVRGDSLSEFYAMGLYPVILYATLRLEQQRSARNVALLALSYALLMLTHNISALVFSPLLGLALLLRSASHRGRSLWLTLGYSVGAVALGLVLSAWFWIPALKDQSLVQLQDQTTGYFNYAGHFRSANLVQMQVWHDYGIDGKRNPFSMGLGQVVLAIACLLALAVRLLRRDKIEPLQGLGLVTLTIYTWLITPGSRWVWDHLPLLPIAQFPWRLLSIQALAISLLCANIPTVLPPNWGRAFALLGILFAAATGMVALRLDRLPLREADITPERLMFYETYSGNIGTTIRHEYLPREMVPRPYVSAVQWQAGTKPSPLVLEGKLTSATLVRSGTGWEAWQIDAPSAALLAFHTTYMPGWRATVDGREHPLEVLPGLGLIGLRLEPGAHRIDVHLGSTPVRRVTSWISILGLLVWLALLLRDWQRSPRTRRRALIGGAVLVACTAWISIAPLRRPAPAPPHGPLIADFSRAPYLHEEPEGIIWGQARLVGYEIGRQQCVPGETLRISLTWDRPWPQYEVRVALVSATAHLLEPAPTWVEGTAALEAETVSIDVILPDELPPGLYVLRVSVWSAERSETPRTVTGSEMGTLALEPIRVLGQRQATGQEPVLGAFGPENMPPVISLVGASVDRLEKSLLVQLTWRSERQAPMNYTLSVRLHDSQAKIASRDLPPLVGSCPTSLWQPGELISDRVLMPWPDNEALPGGPYKLEVVLYDRLTLKAAGTAMIPVTLPD
jgi:hypothetical protein